MNGPSIFTGSLTGPDFQRPPAHQKWPVTADLAAGQIYGLQTWEILQGGDAGDSRVWNTKVFQFRQILENAKVVEVSGTQQNHFNRLQLG